MEEEFEGGVCGGKWWDSSSTNLFRSSACSLATNEDVTTSFGWPISHDVIMMMDVRRRRSSDDSTSDGSSSANGSSSNNMPFDSSTCSLQTMGRITLSSSSTNPDDHWNNQDLQLHDSSGRSEENYTNILQEARALDDSSMNYWQQNEVEFPQIHTNFTQDSSSTNSFKQVNQSFPLSQPLNSISTNTSTECQGLSAGFPSSSASYSYTSSLLQTLFDDQSQQSLLLVDNNNQKFDYSSASNNYQANPNEFLPSFPTASPIVNPYFAKQQPTNHLPLWNGTPSTQSQLLPSSLHNKKPNLHSFSSKHQNEEGRELGGSVAKKASNEAALKRPRIETPSPLPTFKVRKEKLGDRITALQQLVSPFGKTDTASVLHEAIEYIKFLHDQVTALSSPYLKYGSPPLQRLQAANNANDDEEGRIQLDLKRRGLCLVPISSTFPVAAETTTDFWTPTTFGSGNFK